MTTPQEIKAEYTSSLADLTFNSKPLINVLTMLAEENLPNAKVIVEAIETHLSKVATDVKLPILYLIDCIVKNVGRTYTTLFSQNIVSTFCSVFKVVDEKTRAEMFKLRQTWNDIFPQKKLYAIDVQISLLDPAWPVTAQPPSNSIHLNPKFLKTPTTKTKSTINTDTIPAAPTAPISNIDKETLLMQEKLIQKQKELLELQQKKLELEVLQTQVKLKEQMKGATPTNILLKPEVAKQLLPPSMNTAKSKPAGITSSVMNQRLQNNIGNQSRINPVNSALASATRPIRDPRLLRQQQKAAHNLSNNNSNPSLDQKSAILENNRNVNNKLGIRKDPRLINKDNLNKPKTFPKSRQQPDNEQKTQKFVSHIDFEKSTSSKSSSSSSLDSPTKTSKSLKSSPSKHKKKDKIVDDSKSFKDVKRDKSQKGDSPTNFKGVKNKNYVRRNLSPSPEPAQDEDLRSLGPPEKQARLQCDTTDEKSNDNNIVSGSKSVDVDLRQLPAVITKKRLSTEASEMDAAKKIKLDVLFGNEDTDLRQLSVSTDRPPTPPPPIISSSESVAEKPESPKRPNNLDAIRAKLANATNREKIMSKSFHKRKLQASVLEDQDLRVPTVHSSIIISPDDEKSIKSGATTQEQQKQLLNKIFMKMEKDKLREAKNKDHEDSFGNISLQPVSDGEFEDTEEENAVPNSDKDDRLRTSDLRVPTVPSSIIISPDDEKIIKSGAMTQEQQKQLLNKIFMKIEKDKLREAKKKDHEDSRNISLQPVSDGEFEDAKEKNAIPNSDKDYRLRTSHLQTRNEEPPPPPSHFYPREARRPPGPAWRGGPTRRGRGGRMPSQMFPNQRPPIRPWIQQPNWQDMPPRNFSPQQPDFQPPLQPSMEEDPSMSPEYPGEQLTNGAVIQDEIKTINIDGIPRDIRYYGETAVVFLNWDDPREVSFQSGVRRIVFNDIDAYVLSFNSDYQECLINGIPHRVRLGAPSREIYIDEVPYECFFGGAGICINLDGTSVTVKLDGPIPQVKIGETKRTDLVAGKINLIINAKIIVPVFLDAKVQKFVIDCETSTLRFVDALKTVLINDVPFNVEFGGLPKPFQIHDKKHFIRFSVLPKGIRPGYVRIADMEGDTKFSPQHDENSEDSMSGFSKTDSNQPVLLVAGTSKKPGGESPEGRSNSPSFYQNLLQPNLNNLDVLSNVLSSSSMVAAAPSTPGGYQIENNVAPTTEIQESQPVNNNAPVIPPPLNISDLFQKLVASGFVKSGQTKPVIEVPPPITSQPNQIHRKFDHPKQVRRPFEKAKPVSFDKPETLKVRQSSLYIALYTGMQCSSCGMRFPPEASMHYSQHLDWHFRQNRKGKRNIRVAASRRWYYSLADWKNYEEIEDLEEREKNYFDQQQQAEIAEDAEEDVEIPSVPADPVRTDECCEVCRDKFDQFFNEEKEEWHLRNAIKVDEKTYHPICYADYQESLLEVTVDESKMNETTEEENTAEIPGLEIILDDDSEDESSVCQPEVVSLEESDESKPPEDTMEEEPEEEDDDDDVILNEVAPIKIIVDDDDDDQDHHGPSEEVQQPVKIKREKNVDDDGFVDVGEGLVSLNKVGQIKIKSEPIEKDGLQPLNESLTTPTETPTEEVPPAIIIEESEVVASHPELVTSMDGNIELGSTATVPVSSACSISGNKIKINISKAMPVIPSKDTSECSDTTLESQINCNGSYALGEEPVFHHLKPALQNVELKKLPHVKKGTELTGLCSIM